MMNIISVKESPEYKTKATQYFQSKWANQDSLMVYEDCIANCITTLKPLPQWYLLEDNGVIIGCADLQ
ncbi:MAG: acetyltransferase, N-acetylglutamate synthase [Clostridiales bacterium]|nr:acetyltransferase, N-acetylglutamate synthase [Clostridiales bacterium]